MRKLNWWLVSIAGIAAAALALLAFFPAVEINIPISTIQASIDERLPLEGDKLGVDYRVDRAIITSVGEGHLQADALIEARAFGREIDFEAKGSGQIIYQDGAFFVKDFTLLDAHMVRDSQPADKPSFLSRVLQSDAVGDVLSGLKGKAIEKATELMSLSLGSRPVYRLKDDLKQSLVQVFLADLRVDGDHVVARIDILTGLWRLLLTVLTFVVMMVAVVAFAIAWIAGPRNGSSPIVFGDLG